MFFFPICSVVTSCVAAVFRIYTTRINTKYAVKTQFYSNFKLKNSIKQTKKLVTLSLSIVSLTPEKQCCQQVLVSLLDKVENVVKYF